MSEDHAASDPNKKKNRKKRKNFLSNAKKYAKKGQLGRGIQIPEELYQYFVGILDVMKQGIDSDEERQALVNNVLERTKGEEVNIIGNQLGCRVIELLIPLSNQEDLERFQEAVTKELRRMFSDNFSSHVIETLISTSCQRATEHLQEVAEEAPKKKRKIEPKYTEEHIQKCQEFTVKIAKYAMNNLEDFVWDSYANHIIRCSIKCLSGITLLPGEKPKPNIFIKTETKIPNYERRLTYKNVPEDYKELVKEFSERLMTWPQFKDMPFENMTSGLLQVLIFGVKNVDKSVTKKLITRLLNESFAPDDWAAGDDDKKEVKVDGEVKSDGQGLVLPPVFKSESAVRLLEACLLVAKMKTYTQIYAKCFINRLAQLATMPMLNFTVQRLFDNVDIKEELEPMFDELSDKFGAIFASGNTGVIVAIAKACLRVKAKQAQFVTALESSLKCLEVEPAKFPIAILRLVPTDRPDVPRSDRDGISVHGSVVLQTVLGFQRPGKAATGLLEMSSEDLATIFCDPKGCHVADAFFKGPFVGVKGRDKMIWKLKGYFQKLALSQHGSRAFEQVFEAASPEQKVKIMTEISDKSNLLNSTTFGRLIASKYNVELFKKSQDNWKRSVCKVNKE